MTIDKYIFKRPLETYLRYIDPTKEYIKQSAVFISKFNNKDLKSCTQDIKSTLKTFNIRNPKVRYNTRDVNGDMMEDTCKLTDYIKDVQEAKEVLVPSFTSYVHPSVEKSLHAEFINVNVKARKQDKALSFKYGLEGDKEKEDYYDNMQKTRKIFNNSLSGAYASAGTILFNPSAHYTLTSMTRSLSSISNAVSESMVYGNKLFLDPESIVNYITAIISNTDYDNYSKVMEKYNIYYPTVEEVMESILECSKWYFNTPERMVFIKEYLEKLNKVELASILYTNDFYHIRVYNEKLVRYIVTEMSNLRTNHCNDIKIIDDLPEGIMMHAHVVCSDLIRGMNVNYKDLVGTPTLDALISTGVYISEFLTKYKDFFTTFFVTEIAPPNVSKIKAMIRKVIVLSDTDSTCGSYDNWVKWYFGTEYNGHDVKQVSVASAVMTVVTQVVDHYIKILCGSMNIAIENMDLLKMKNEFYWHSFVTMNASKHYFADTAIREGNVYKEPEPEVKGVHLLASKVHERYRKYNSEIMDYVKEKNRRGEKIDLVGLIKRVADIEREIIERIKMADLDILSTDRIKAASSYKNEPERSPYIHHMLWTDVFKDKYGDPGEPTYTIVKVPTTLTTNKKLTEYLESIEDKEIANRLGTFLNKYNKNNLGTFRPPLSLVASNGIPKEILDCLDYYRIVTDNCLMFYTTLEALGFYRPSELLICEMGPY